MIEIISICILLLIYLWVLYNVPILTVGIRQRTKYRSLRLKDINPGDLPRFSVIVPAKNEEAVIGRLLEALLKVNYPPRKREIIVVEGGSTDNTAKICMEYAGKYPRQIRLFQEGLSRGKPSALNHALDHAKGEIVAVFDADNVPDPDILLRAANYFRDPSVAAVQGTMHSINAEENMLTKIASREEAAWFQSVMLGRDALNLFVPLTGSCQFIRREVLEELGGWDESSLAEDVEMTVRLNERGYTVKLAVDVESWQETPTSITQLIRQRMRWFQGYMETTIKYGRLLTKMSRLNLDVEVTLLGPYVLVLCFLSYLTTSMTFLFPIRANPVLGALAYTATLLMVVTLLLVGLVLVHMSKPRKIRNLLWIPFIYAYWILQTLIATHALTQVILRRPRKWTRTMKTGTVTIGD
ncbi:MAG: glycosyltransferase [Candidatus Geothermarchaeales archaeon]